MKKYFQLETISIGLAIFSMFFGAGDLIYPISAGMDAGSSKFIISMLAFLITSVALPLMGLVSMILFDGDYKAFLYRLGNIPGYILLIVCMLIIGPVIATPRIITLSYIMMSPFLPGISLLSFTILFLLTTYLCTYRESKIVDMLGKVISPALLISLAIIIVKAILIPSSGDIVNNNSLFTVFKQNIWRGYETLGLLGAIFFSSIILHILKMNYKNKSSKELAFLGFRSGVLGIAVLAVVYVGLGLLGMLHGSGLENNSGALFKEISFRVLGSSGAIIISIAVLMACLSTSIALGSVVAEFFQLEILKGKISFAKSLAIVLLSCVPLSLYGLDKVLQLTAGPITFVGYPILITLAFVNICYKLFGFKPVKIPVLIVGALALASYLGFF